MSLALPAASPVRPPAPPRSRTWVLALLLLAVFGLPARADADGADEEGFKRRDRLETEQQLAWMAGIAKAEHARQVLEGVAEYVVGGYPKEVRWRAIVALGRIGNDATGVRILRRLLREGGEDLGVALWSAGLTGDKSLVPDVLPHLETKDKDADPATVGLAIEAVGRLGDVRAVGYVRPFLDGESASLRALALDALVRMKAERELEAVLLHTRDADADVRRAVAAAAWRLSGARRKALSTEKAPWAGDERVARSVATLATDPDPETRLFAHRALSFLLPKAVMANDPGTGNELPDAVALAGVADTDPRVVADVVSRLLATHEGPDVDAALRTAGANPDPLVRETVAATLEGKATPAGKTIAAEMLGKEGDARVREALAVTLATCGDGAAAKAVLARTDRPDDAARRDVTLARVLLATKDPKDLEAALSMLRFGKASALAKNAILDGLAERAHDELRTAVLAACADGDPVVRATAASVLGEKGTPDDVAPLAALWPVEGTWADRDLRGAIAEAVAKLASRKDAPVDAVVIAERIVRRAVADPSAAVRAAGRKAAEGMPTMKALASTPDRQPNDWKGLPRPKGAVLGLELPGDSPFLSEREILELASVISDRGVKITFETTAGRIAVAVDAVRAPVHAVNLVLCAQAGVYDGTPWHRVVPAFVIQGGDPRGDGSGDAGYSLPDEITPRPFVRGALGMPKGDKDTGGCQLFLMHCAAPHLDGAYTCYGEVVHGLEVIDRIRVGDRILKATVEVAPGAPAAR